MIQLYQFPWSPFCIVIRRILEYGRIPHRLVPVSVADRTTVWKLTRRRYYQVPVIKDGRNVIFETGENSQVIAKYLNNKFKLDLFPEEFRGVQTILWQWIEERVEGAGFKLNDIYYREFVPNKDHLGFLRHKERKFGRGCVEQWARDEDHLLEELNEALLPFDLMLASKPYLMGEHPVFIDFDLYGMISNFLFSGHYELPSGDDRLAQWYQRMSRIRKDVKRREKLHS